MRRAAGRARYAAHWQYAASLGAGRQELPAHLAPDELVRDLATVLRLLPCAGRYATSGEIREPGPPAFQVENPGPHHDFKLF